MTEPEMNEAPRDRRQRAFGAHVRAHARGLSAVAAASILGVLASFVFQVLSARYLAPTDFGLLSAFLVVVSVAAIGSSSLQNIVTVQTADALAHPGVGRRKGNVPWESIGIGLAGGIGVAIAAPAIAAQLNTTPAMIVAAAACIPLSFVFANSLGLLQGAGRVSGAVWWSTVSLIARILLLVLAVVVGAGLAGVVGAVVGATAVSVVGALWSARRIPQPPRGIFTLTGLTIVLLTVAFAWLTSSDVFFLRAGGPAALAGTYASAIVLVKAGFLVPSTLSFYLLPRFVRNRDNPRLARVGVLVTLALSVATSLAMALVFALLGGWIIQLLYGSAYSPAAKYLVPATLAYLPWMAAQGMLIKMTSSASKSAAAVLIFAVVAQWLAFTALVPNVSAMLIAFGSIGIVILAAFFVIDGLGTRRITRERTAQ